MNIIPQAKPIRFTIVSGGEECSSLEMLRKNFRVLDVIKSKDRLCRWLKQNREHELCDKLLSLPQIDNGLIELINISNVIFDGKYNSCDSLSNLNMMINDNVLSWDDDIVTEALSTDEEMAKKAYKLGASNPLIWLSKHSDTTDGELLFMLGKEYIRKGGFKNITTGKKCIAKAVEMGWEDAIEYENSGTFEREMNTCTEISPDITEISEKLRNTNSIKEAQKYIAQLNDRLMLLPKIRQGLTIIYDANIMTALLICKS